MEDSGSMDDRNALGADATNPVPPDWSGNPVPREPEPTEVMAVPDQLGAHGPVETPTAEVPVTGVGSTSAGPPPPPPPPPWATGPAGVGDPGGAYWGQGSVPPGSPPPPPPPPYFYGGAGPYGPPPAHASSPTHKPLGSWWLATVAAVAVVAASATVGASVEYALNHSTTTAAPGLGTTTPGSSGFGSGPSGLGSGSGSTGSGSSGLGSGSGSSGSAPAGLNTTAIAAKVDPSLVDVETTLAQGGAGAGTGMVLTASGLVLTNNHVIENALTINVQVVGSNRTYSATVLGYSVTDDVALLQLQNASGLKPVSLGKSSNVSVGQPVVAIGNAGGTGGTPTAVGGTITALNQTITAGDSGTLSETLSGLIETDANIQPGDSGGALVNTSGQVIGMNTAASASGGVGGPNQGYAIVIDHARSLVSQIKNGQSSSTVQIGPRALLGVEVSGGSQSGGSGFSGGTGGGSGVAGAYVDGVQSASAADSAGIGTGDTIVSVNGTTITSASDLTNALLKFKPGNSVTVGWVDTQGTSHTASVQLTTGPPA
jgi:S1-C subfamily serine protease